MGGFMTDSWRIHGVGGSKGFEFARGGESFIWNKHYEIQCWHVQFP